MLCVEVGTDASTTTTTTLAVWYTTAMSTPLRFVLVVLLTACHAQTSAPPSHLHAHGSPSNSSELETVRTVHGGAGPWVVAGYRMGRYALRQLGLARGSFDLDVAHASPAEVQYSCIADGAAAATGASLGKLNLHWREVARPDTQTTYTRRSTGQRITLSVTKTFASRYADVPRPQLSAAGEEVLELPDAAIFEVVRSPER